MKILFTGASSFTGYWFVRTLVARGHEVISPLTRDPDSYTDIRKQRVERIKSICTLVPHSPFGSDNFLKLLQTEKIDLLCHHGANVTNYKSEDFDTISALQNNTRNLPAILKTLKCPLILTGSVFEQDEGRGSPPMRAFSPYGLSKGLTFQLFRYYCEKAGLPLGKFVIPNPFGPFEEPRFTAHLMRTWKQGNVAEIKTPDYVRDNIHVDLLAMIYADFAGRVAIAGKALQKINPSNYAARQGEFAQRVAREVASRTGWACGLKLHKQTDFNEPLERINTDPAAEMTAGWSESKAWDGFVEFYAN